MKIFVSWLNYAFMSIFFGCLFIFQLTQTQSSFFHLEYTWNRLQYIMLFSSLFSPRT